MTPEPVVIGDATLYCGDVLAVLATLPDESIHCIVTSPPYWNLRDYGTGQWEGGSAECDHRENGTDRGKRDELPKPPAGWAERAQGQPFKDICGKCGARRIDAQIGLESTPEEYVAKMVEVFRTVRRVLRKDGTLWLNLGSSYAGGGRAGKDGIQKWGGIESENQDRKYGPPSGDIPGFKPKDMIPIPWMVAMALQTDGWYLRSDIIWAKPNPMPESVTDRPTKAHEYLFLLSKSARYFYDAEAIRENGNFEPHGRGGDPDSEVVAVHHVPGKISRDTVREWGVANGRNRRTVWTIATEPYPEAHFATFPRKLVQPCILAGCPEHACPKCGAPWMREVKKTFHPQEDVDPSKRIRGSHGTKGMPERNGWQGVPRGSISTIPTGEHPTCTCGPEEVPEWHWPPIGGTVLDPFGGSGTVGEVALEYGRRAILIDLKPEYIEMAKKRIRPVAGRPLLPFAAVEPTL
jgi:DNA modification methylase